MIEKPQGPGVSNLAARRGEELTLEFMSSCETALLAQYDRFELYGALCKQSGVHRDDLSTAVRNRDLARVPSIPTGLFKRSKSLLADLNDLEQPDGTWTASSSTSGDPSYVLRSDDDLRIMLESYLAAYSKTPGTDLTLVLSPSHTFATSKNVVRRLELDDGRRALPQYAVPLRGAESHFHDLRYVVRIDMLRTLSNMIVGNRRPVFRTESRTALRKLLAKAKRNGLSVTLCPNVLLLYPAVMRYDIGELELGDRAFVLTGAGGWGGKKGIFNGEPIDKRTYVADLCTRLGIPRGMAKERFFDIYAFTENHAAHFGSWSDDLSDFVFETAGDTVVYAMNPQTGKPVGPGEVGMFSVISPAGCERTAGVCVVQDDLVKVIDSYRDGSVKRFTGVRRTESSAGASAGCAYSMDGD